VRLATHYRKQLAKGLFIKDPRKQLATKAALKPIDTGLSVRSGDTEDYN